MIEDGSRVILFARRHSSGLMVLCLSILLGILPLVWGNPYTLGLTNLIAIDVIVVLGLNLFVGYAGQISLGHASFFGLGAYGTAILTSTYEYPAWPVMVGVAAIVGLIAWLVGGPTLRLKSHYLAMATVGLNVVIYTILVQWDKVTGGPSGLSGIPPLTIGDFRFTNDFRFHYLAWGFAMAAFMLCINLVRSGMGRGLAALAEDEAAASCLGVDVKNAKIKVFVLSAVLASIAGSLYAHMARFVSPETFGIFASLDFVTMVVIGGTGSIWGTLFGVAFLRVLPEYLTFFEDWKEVLHGLILVGILLFLPQGLVVGVVDLVKARSARKKLAAEAAK